MRPHELRRLRQAALAAMLLLATVAARADDARSAIAAVNAQFCEAVAKADGKSIAALYSADAQLLPAGHEAIKGGAAIEKFMQGMVDSGVAGLSLTTTELFGRGASVTEVGEYQMRDKAGSALDHGKYIVVWRHHNGHWKLHRDIFTSSVTPKT